MNAKIEKLVREFIADVSGGVIPPGEIQCHATNLDKLIRIADVIESDEEAHEKLVGISIISAGEDRWNE